MGPKMYETWHVCEDDRLLGLSIVNTIKARDLVPGHSRGFKMIIENSIQPASIKAPCLARTLTPFLVQ